MEAKVITIQTPFLDADEAAQFLKIARQTLYEWAGDKSKKLPKRYHGKRLVFLADELIEWSNAQNGILRGPNPAA